jgi:kinetochore protein NDC80
MDPTFGSNSSAGTTTANRSSSGNNNSNSNNNNNAPKFEEEVALHFKALGYPYPVSKTALVAAGSPHTWPSLLAALVWLVEHIVVIQEAGCMDAVDFDELVGGVGGESHHPFESLVELEDKTERAFFAFLHKSYAAFLAGHGDVEAVTDKLIDMFEQDNMVIEREMDRITDLNGGMVETIHMLQQQSQRYGC